MGDGTHDTRNLWLWLVSGLAVLALCIVSAVFWSARLTSFWAQSIGSLTAFLGLLSAYMRAKHPGESLREQFGGFIKRLTGSQHRAMVGSVGPIEMIFSANAYGTVGLTDRPELELQQQIDALADYLREHVNPKFQDLYGRVQKLKAESERIERLVNRNAEQSERNTLRQIEELKRELNHSAALDLRWAIFGLYVATIGVALSW